MLVLVTNERILHSSLNLAISKNVRSRNINICREKKKTVHHTQSNYPSLKCVIYLSFISIYKRRKKKLNPNANNNNNNTLFYSFVASIKPSIIICTVCLK